MRFSDASRAVHISITGAGLEEAFLALTGEPDHDADTTKPATAREIAR